jgi:dCMP deaminase
MDEIEGIKAGYSQATSYKKKNPGQKLPADLKNKYNAYHRWYRKSNKERHQKALEMSKGWKRNNIFMDSENKRKWALSNPDKMKKSSHDWARKNKMVKMANSKIIEILRQVAYRSTCCRLQVGSILYHNCEIISMGYNGVNNGQTCYEYFLKKYVEKGIVESTFSGWTKTENFKILHKKFSKVEIHAEKMCLLRLDPNIDISEKAILYTTCSPCLNCSKSIKLFGVKTVLYLNKYDRPDDCGIKYLRENDIIVDKLL